MQHNAAVWVLQANTMHTVCSLNYVSTKTETILKETVISVINLDIK